MAVTQRTTWGSNKKSTPTGRLLSDAMRERAARQVAAKKEAALNFLEWALKLPEAKTGTLNFARFPFQKELYEEGFATREVVVRKATQVGVSAWALRWILAHADRYGRTGLYIFPTRDTVFDFSDSRIKPVLDASDYMQDRLGEPQNKGLRKVGLGLVYFRGSESSSGAQSIDADTLVLDEYDLLDPGNLPDLEKRVSGPLSASLLRRLGNPTDEGWGIDAAYERSDKRQWHVKCTKCRTWQPITYDDNVNEEKLLIVCKKCDKPLDVGSGEWVAEFPDRDVRGYHLSRLIVPGREPGTSHDLQEVVTAHHVREPYRFKIHMNKDLGLPWSPSEGRLKKSAIQAAQSLEAFRQQEGYSGNNFITMGVDVASKRNLNVRISELLPNGMRKGLYIREVESFNEVDKLMRQFRVNLALIDHEPEFRSAMNIVNRYPGRAFLVAYTPNQKLVLNVADLDDGIVKVRRVEPMDSTIEQINAQRNLLPQDLPEGYVDQMRSPSRSVDEDETGRRIVTYKKRGPDDFFHAETYDLIAHEVFLILQTVDHELSEEFTTLDEHIEFERAEDTDDMDYRRGPDEPDVPSMDDW